MTETTFQSFGDDVPAAPSPAVGTSPLAGLLADLHDAQQEHESVEIDVPGKTGVTVRFSTAVPYELYAAWRRTAIDPELKTFNELTWALSVVVGTCQAVRVDGEDTTDTAGPVTFTSASLLEALGAARPVDAARKFYRKDGYVIAVANAVIAKAGYLTEATPTTR